LLASAFLQSGRERVASVGSLIRGRRSNKVYFTRTCGSRATVRATRDREHAEKLSLATKASADWCKLSAKRKKRRGWKPAGWKQHVSKQHSEITVRFLTRVVNNDELQPPAESLAKTRNSHTKSKRRKYSWQFTEEK
jgi:hypothetical protein